MSSLFANACAPALLADACAPALLAVPVVSGALEAPVTVPVWIELIAIVVASVSGALTAREKKLDLVGAVCLAALCSLGGGLLRDMTLQVGDVYILNQPLAMPAAILTAAIVFIAPSVVAKQDRLIAVLDIFAVGLYAATGADKALVYGFNPIICITMGFFTGVGGGMLRDVFLGEVPYIFQRSNLYALAAIAGAGVYVALAALGVSHTAGASAAAGASKSFGACGERGFRIQRLRQAGHMLRNANSSITPRQVSSSVSGAPSVSTTSESTLRSLVPASSTICV